MPLDTALVLRRLDEERRGLSRNGEVLDQRPFVTRLRATDGSHHLIAYSSVDAETADAVIEEEIEHHRRLGVGFEWKAYGHDQPADLLERLRRRGFDIGPKECVLVYALNEQQALQTPVGAAEHPTAVRIDRIEQIGDFRQVAEEVFGKDYAFTSGQLAVAIRAGSTQHRGYVAYAGSTPLSIGRLYTHPQSWFGGLYGGATLGSHRGQGYYRAIVAARARDAIEAGARFLIVDALPTSRPILERVGFQRITDTWPCEWRP